jgi:putative phosphoesterase
MKETWMNDNVIGILSDTHDNRSSIHRAVDLFTDAGCSLVVHAGDFIAPFTAREFSRLTCPFIGVFGNNDGDKNGLRRAFEKVGALYGPPHEFTHDDRRLVVMHEPDYIEEYLARSDIDVVIHGHTHHVEIRAGHPLLLNPGECCSWITGKSSVILLDLVSMEVRVEDVG